MFESRDIESLLGRTFNGIRVTRFVGWDGKMAVFEGVQEPSAQPVTIKFFDPQVNADETFPQRFAQGAQAAIQLTHPNIVRVLDYGSDGPLHFIITERIDGERLRDRLATSEPLPAGVKAKIVQEVGSALVYAHRQGQVHGQITPNNIFLAKDGRVLLSDFGVARIVEPPDGVPVLTGAPEYMAPEQGPGGTAAEPRTDLYALAIVAYELLVGRVPFQAPSRLAVLRMQQSSAPPPPSSLVPGFPQGVEAVLMRALAKNPDERHESVATFVDSLVFSMGPTEQRTTPLPVAPTTPPASAHAVPPSEARVSLGVRRPSAGQAPLKAQARAVFARMTRVIRESRLAKAGVITAVAIITILMFSPVFGANATLSPLSHAGTTLRPLKIITNTIMGVSPSPSPAAMTDGVTTGTGGQPHSPNLQKAVGGLTKVRPLDGTTPPTSPTEGDQITSPSPSDSRPSRDTPEATDSDATPAAMEPTSPSDSTPIPGVGSCGDDEIPTRDGCKPIQGLQGCPGGHILPDGACIISYPEGPTSPPTCSDDEFQRGGNCGQPSDGCIGEVVQIIQVGDCITIIRRSCDPGQPRKIIHNCGGRIITPPTVTPTTCVSRWFFLHNPCGSQATPARPTPTVTVQPCASPQVRRDGQCVTPETPTPTTETHHCTPPEIDDNGKCIIPSITGPGSSTSTPVNQNNQPPTNTAPPTAPPNPVTPPPTSPPVKVEPSSPPPTAPPQPIKHDQPPTNVAPQPPPPPPPPSVAPHTPPPPPVKVETPLPPPPTAPPKPVKPYFPPASNGNSGGGGGNGPINGGLPVNGGQPQNNGGSGQGGGSQHGNGGSGSGGTQGTQSGGGHRHPGPLE